MGYYNFILNLERVSGHLSLEWTGFRRVTGTLASTTIPHCLIEGITKLMQSKVPKILGFMILEPSDIPSITHLSELFTSTKEAENRVFSWALSYPSILRESHTELCRVPTIEELHIVLSSFKPGKYRDLMDPTQFFFLKCWPTICNSVSEVVSRVFYWKMGS